VDEFSIGGERQFMEAAIMTSFDPARASSIKGLGHRKYWLIGAWSKFESFFVDFFGLAILGLEILGSTTWGAFVCMFEVLLLIVCLVLE